MFSLLSRMASAGASQLSRLATSPFSRTISQSTTDAITGRPKMEVVKVKEKYFRHYFLNRWMARDNLRRVIMRKHYPLRQRLITIKKCKLLPRELQAKASRELGALPRDSIFHRIKHRCILTSRPRWVIRRYRLSRIQWRLLADYNKLSGVMRATW